MIFSADFENIETTLTWNNLTVTVSEKRNFSQSVWGNCRRRQFKESSTILKGVSGCAVTGNLIAIMGPSGAGKTTFLAALAGRTTPTAGSVKINDEILPRDAISKISSYLPQFDALPNSLTVEEHLLFSYALKMNVGKRQRRYLSTKLLTELGLIDCKEVWISKLSGGQRKRLSLASELITRPKILFLDEPTTGLDTFSALQVVQTLRTISVETIVLCTIHQPGMDIYNFFTHVLLLSDGRTAYFGTLEDATKFFSSLGYECPVGFDESEYYIKLLSPQNPETSPTNPNCKDTAARELIDKICGEFSRSSPTRIPEITNNRQLEIEPQRKAGFIRQFFWLTWRIWIQNRRTVCEGWISWLSYFLSMAAVATFYTGINPGTQEGVQNARGALYMMSSEISFTVAYSVIYEFPGQLLIYLREDGVYGSGPYYVATFLGLIPKAVLKAVIFTAVIYFILIARFDFVNFLFYCLTTSAAAICGTAYGLMFCSWIDDIDMATSIMVPIDMLFLLTAGMFYSLRSLPTYLTCFKYFSIFFYLNEALSIIYWSRVDDIDCQSSSDLPCLRNGVQVLSEYGFEETNFAWDMSGLAALTLTMSLAGYFGVRRRRKINATL
ncbi:Protein scarlet [Habropoda laboriosa]|uniref:Protein scarlet n=1 Tax=Habropoda laboriosa TaxID=597456 RepID=A0A0L7QUJ7_9HYME|nr:PREDICTED: protein scarlet-like [Habropoda laboriosa]KOC62136.1 Protein scarlet [Habropoda laboriosa]